MSKNIYAIAFGVLLFALPLERSSAQTWEVPADKVNKVSPFKFSPETTKKGEALYQRNCVSCHGEPSKGNFSNLTPSPGDPASVKFQNQTDGALFHKITAGRSPMPEFKNVLTEEERWQIIAYFRSFNPKYVQPEPVAAPAGKYGGMEIKTDMKFIPEKRQIKITATGYKEKESIPLAGVEMLLFAKRYFGDLKIDETKTTDAEGVAYFEYKDSIPGDSAGNVSFLVKLNAEGLSGYKQEAVLKAGKAVNAPSLIATRAMWTVRSQAPIWLLVSYSLVVIVVWSIIFYIVSLILKIRKAGVAYQNEEVSKMNKEERMEELLK